MQVETYTNACLEENLVPVVSPIWKSNKERTALSKMCAEDMIAKRNNKGHWAKVLDDMSDDER